MVQAKKYIWVWKTQQFRTDNQDQAKYDVLDALSRSSTLLVMDWVMKPLPRTCANHSATGLLNVAFFGTSQWLLQDRKQMPRLRSSLLSTCLRAALRIVVTAILKDVIETLKEHRCSNCHFTSCY